MKGQYTFYLIIQKNATTRISSDRYDWQDISHTRMWKKQAQEL